MFVGSSLQVAFFYKWFSIQLNGLVLNSGVREILGEKDYCAVDLVFSIGYYIDRAPEFKMDASTTGVHCMYSDIIHKVVSQNYG